MKNNPFDAGKEGGRAGEGAEKANLSDDGNLPEETKDFENETVAEETCGGETGILKKKIDFLEKSLQDKNEEILRRAADLDNYRKRITKESEDRVKYGCQAVLKDFIPVLDNIELTLRHTSENSSLKEGLELTIKSFKDALSKHGVKEIDAEPGVPFDPEKHEALMTDNDEKYDNNAVTMNIQRGYTLNDRVIRHAKVKVNKK